jgi:Na+/citrate or Na+/malate symporter
MSSLKNMKPQVNFCVFLVTLWEISKEWLIPRRTNKNKNVLKSLWDFPKNLRGIKNFVYISNATEKAVSAIPAGLKCEPRCSSSYYIVTIQNNVVTLVSVVMSVTVYDESLKCLSWSVMVPKVSVVVCDGSLRYLLRYVMALYWCLSRSVMIPTFIRSYC